MSTTSTPAPSPAPLGAKASTGMAGQSIDEGKGRTFPCVQCGADLKFHVGEQSLKCPYCGHAKNLELKDGEDVVEQDFHALLDRLVRQRIEGQTETVETSEVRCGSCGSSVTFTGTLTSSSCAYCGSPVQRQNVHRAEHRVPVDGLLPFQVDRSLAQKNLREWVGSRWFAPSDFLKYGVEGRPTGVYMPYWTYDSMTANWYSGERGEHYYVNVGSGDKKRRERRTRWYPANGSFQRFFDDVLVCAAKGLPRRVVQKLEPWPLKRCLPFNQESLAGFLAETYQIPVDEGFREAKSRIEAAIRADVKRQIGGDTQRIHRINTDFAALTYKHLLLPVWLLAYKYHEKSYQVVINAGTGEVQGERPYSWVKITLAVLAVLAVAALVWLIAR